MKKYAQTTLSDRDWWRSAGDKLNLTLVGWTFRYRATFVDNVTDETVEMTGAVAGRLNKLRIEGEAKHEDTGLV